MKHNNKITRQFIEELLGAATKHNEFSVSIYLQVIHVKMSQNSAITSMTV
jgi:hypothetical protein